MSENYINITGERVPVEKIGQFNSLLKKCEGRYLNNPLRTGDVFICNYSLGDGYGKFCRVWQVMNSNIVEKRSPKWRVFVRRWIGI